MNEYKIFAQMSFDWMIVAYFFLGGISAGSYFFSVAANYWKQEFKPLAKTAAIVTPIALAIGLGILLIDLGQPLRGWRLFLSFNPRSALSWGVWFLNIFFFLSVVYSGLLLFRGEEKAKKVAYIGLPFGVLVGTYTGVLLNQAPGKVLWHSPLVPVLFLVGGIVSGLALVLLISTGKVEKSISVKLGKVIVGFLLLELSLVVIEILALSNGSQEAVHAITVILRGEYTYLFWIVEILLGAIIPLLVLLRAGVSPRAQRIASVLILVGIFAMRYIIVIGGQV